MSISPRIPEWTNDSFDGMASWFSKMSARGLLFHPDDDPAEIVSIAHGMPTFSTNEIDTLEEIIRSMFKIHEKNVYEAAYPCFMAAIGN